MQVHNNLLFMIISVFRSAELNLLCAPNSFNSIYPVQVKWQNADVVFVHAPNMGFCLTFFSSFPFSPLTLIFAVVLKVWCVVWLLYLCSFPLTCMSQNNIAVCCDF